MLVFCVWLFHRPKDPGRILEILENSWKHPGDLVVEPCLLISRGEGGEKWRVKESCALPGNPEWSQLIPNDAEIIPCNSTSFYTARK